MADLDFEKIVQEAREEVSRTEEKSPERDEEWLPCPKGGHKPFRCLKCVITILDAQVRALQKDLSKLRIELRAIKKQEG